jgi:hypothetical protein
MCLGVTFGSRMTRKLQTDRFVAKALCTYISTYKVKVSKAIPVKGRGGLWG